MSGTQISFPIRSFDPALSAVTTIVVALNASPVVVIALTVWWLTLREQRLMKSS